MAGILTKGIKLSYGSGEGSSETWVEIANLQECPELGGAADKVDVTCLADENYKYINGIKDFGDLAFTFLYDASETTSNFQVCKGFETSGARVHFQVEFPDSLTASGHGTTFTFYGYVSCSTGSASVNAPITFTMNVTLNSDIVVDFPE